jgi:hypothetical protein
MTIATVRPAALLKGHLMHASVPVLPVAVLLERLARREHARLAWTQRDHPELPRHHGEFVECSHVECVQVRQALSAER